MVKLTRSRRAYIIAAAVGALVTAANASQGAYFSQSWGWVALAFLVPTSVLLIVDSASAPGRLRAAFARLMVAFGYGSPLGDVVDQLGSVDSRGGAHARVRCASARCCLVLRA